MACGCADNSCACVIQGAGETTVSGAGTAGNPFVINTPASPLFAASNPGGGITITPGGTLGHTPAFDLEIDPASTAPVSVSGDGLRVDCCDAGSSTTVQLVTIDTTLDGTSNVILVVNTLIPIEVTLPAATTVFKLDIKDYGEGVGGPFTGNSSAMTITITPDGTDTIEGLTNYVMSTTDGQSVTLVADGVTNWAAV